MRAPARGPLWLLSPDPDQVRGVASPAPIQRARVTTLAEKPFGDLGSVSLGAGIHGSRVSFDSRRPCGKISSISVLLNRANREKSLVGSSAPKYMPTFERSAGFRAIASKQPADNRTPVFCSIVGIFLCSHISTTAFSHLDIPNSSIYYEYSVQGRLASKEARGARSTIPTGTSATHALQKPSYSSDSFILP